jgi:hypothetical protein
MSVPLFFEPYEISDIPTGDPNVQAAWTKTGYAGTIPKKVGQHTPLSVLVLVEQSQRLNLHILHKNNACDADRTRHVPDYTAAI